MSHDKRKFVDINYRIVVNEHSELYKHIEPLGSDLIYAKNEFNRLKDDLNSDDTMVLEEEIDFSDNWTKILKHNY